MPRSRADSRALDVATDFAPAERASSATLTEQMRLSMSDPLVKVVLEAVHGFVMVLNTQRQILAANQELLDALQRECAGSLIGLRPGEALNCVRFGQGPNGCGTGVQCRNCGAVLTILASQHADRPVTGECRLLFEQDGRLTALDLQVRATPLQVGSHKLTALVLHDISAVKRRDVLERLLLHDMLNTLGGIGIWTELLSGEEPEEAARQIMTLTEWLREEIRFQQVLLQAEEGQLVTSPRSVTASEVLSKLEDLFSRQMTEEGKHIDVKRPEKDEPITVDSPLLLRVLSNMVRNATEATPPGGCVQVWFERRQGRPAFVVHNTGVMDPVVQQNMFGRSFSTKGGRGRGLGAYSMKLFGERYLGGTVSFTSSKEEGTSFFIILPSDGNGTKEDTDTDAEDLGGAIGRVSSGDGVSPEDKGRILLVDDDEVIIKLCRRALERIGHTVTACSSGREALDLFRVAPHVYRVVLTDVSMPELSGLDLSREILRIRPDIPIIVCSGYGDDVTADEARKAGARGFLRKPCSVQELRDAVQRLFAAAP